MKRTYRHVSDMKTELVKKGWISRQGRHGVVLLVGKFPPPKVRSFGKNPNEAPSSFGKNPNEARPRSEKSESFVRISPNENQIPPHPPIRIEPEVAKPVAAATAAADLLMLPADEEFVREVIASEVYGAEFVRWVWGKLKLHCVAGGSRPVRRQLLHWLSTETGAPPVQPTLPGVGAPLVAGGFGNQAAINPVLRDADPNCRLCAGTGESGGQACPCRACQFCFGAGMEMVDGRMRKCRCRLPPAQAPEMSEDELREEQEIFDAAQATLRQANST